MLKIIKMLSAVIILYAISLTTVYAGMGGFTIDPVFPENQVEDTQSFFDIETNVGETQQISVIVTNTTDGPMSVELALNTAITNYNRVLDYTNADPDLTNPYAFSNIASFADAAITAANGVVSIPPGESVEVFINIAIPQGGFDGIILGAVRALQYLSAEDIAGGGMVVSRMAITTPVRLRGGNTDVDVDFIMGEINAELVRGRANIIADIAHPNPRLTLGVEMSATIYPIDSEDPIFGMSGMQVDFAPRSVFPLRFEDQAGFGVVAGDYRAVITLEHNGLTWNFEETFTISPEVAQEVNMGAVNLQQQAPGLVAPDNSPATTNTMMMIAIVAVVVLLLVVIVMLVMKQKRGLSH
ncbi:MAG: DUF916 and DUF3324 domain-containing protein [Defluviitaleaceae bacterium]|nr:DUF916 and DUF3324 domain-containing protein [Defluviitaleaceae bacterium]